MEKYRIKLQERISKGSERSLSLFPGFVDFFSNDYLGLSHQVESGFSQNGSTGSRLLSGNSAQAEEAEKFLADFFQAEAALVFNSGYDANLGLFSSVPQRGDTILYDELIHASVRDGIRLSHANAFSFRHNNSEDLIKKIDKATGTIFVAVESLYSMDGDLSVLQEIAIICKAKNALLIVDEAHAGGIFGNQGKGLCAELNLIENVFARVFTFGKSYGTHGATIIGSQELKTYLINFARSFIYTTALPPHQYTLIQAQIEFSKSEELRIKLRNNIELLRQKLGTQILLSDPKSPIQVVLTPGVERTKNIATTLQGNNFAVKAILSPTVAVGQERIRICIHNFNTSEEITSFAAILCSQLEI